MEENRLLTTSKEFGKAEGLPYAEAADALTDPHAALVHRSTPNIRATYTERYAGTADTQVQNTGNNRYSVIHRSRAAIGASVSHKSRRLV